jgi:hypothetical protein
MTKFYMRWQLNQMLIPTKPEDRVKLWLSMLETVKADLQSGVMTEWGMCNDASAGYAFINGDEKKVYDAILKWFPYVSFDIKPILTVDQLIDSIKAAAAKK